MILAKIQALGKQKEKKKKKKPKQSYSYFLDNGPETYIEKPTPSVFKWRLAKEKLDIHIWKNVPHLSRCTNNSSK